MTTVISASIRSALLPPRVAFLASLGLLMLLAGCSLLDPQSILTLRDVMNAEYDGTDITTQVEEITDTACIAPLDCVEAYSTAEADYFRFETREGAERYGSSLKDGFVINYFVMDFAGKDASAEHQLWAMQTLAGTWNDYRGDFPDRGE